MILNRRLIHQARMRTLDIQSQSQKTKFVNHIKVQKLKQTGLAVTDNELKSINRKIYGAGQIAACFSLDWLPPIILIHSSACQKGNLVWRHERIHYQLKWYRNLKGHKSGSYLLLSLLNLISKENLEIFFKVTESRYPLLAAERDTLSALRFLEEILICALVDYSHQRLQGRYSELRRIDRDDHALFLRKARKILNVDSAEELPSIKFGGQLKSLLFKTLPISFKLTYQACIALANSGAHIDRWR